MKYLLDTNVVSELRKRSAHGAVLAWLRATSNENLFTSSVVIGELQGGVEMTRVQNPEKAAEIERWINEVTNTFAVLVMDSECFREWARLMRKAPEQIGLDAMIAATARIHDLIVVTRNEHDFKHLNVEVFNPFRS